MKTGTKMSHFLTSKLEFPKVKLNINMSLDKNSSNYDLDGQYKQKSVIIYTCKTSLALKSNPAILLFKFHHTIWNVYIQSTTEALFATL